MAVTGTRYDVGHVEGKVRMQNGPKFTQLVDGVCHYQNGSPSFPLFFRAFC